MIRTSAIISLIATASSAQGVGYEDVIAALPTVFEAKIDAYYGEVGDGQYFTQLLASDDTLVFRQPDGALRLFKPELVATYEKSTGICAYGFDVDTYPNLPRVAAASVVLAARENGWDEDAVIAPAEITHGECYVRAAIASFTFDLVMVYPLDTGERWLYLGLPDMGQVP